MAVIDAYEIGIQLMLQEDVSAGLAVINRGLAEVDRAIAATSADLAGLVREAQTATKAVAAAASGRAFLDTQVDKRSIGGADETVQVGSGKEPSGVAAGEKDALPEARTIPPVAPSKPMATQPSNEPIAIEAASREQAVPSSAPIKSALSETVLRGPHPSTRQPEPASGGVDVPAPVQPVAPNSGVTVPPLSREIAAAKEERPRASKSRAPEVAVTAAVSREHRFPTPGQQSERVLHQSVSGSASRRERPVAPWSGIDPPGQQSQMTRLHEKAAAPQSSGRSQNELGGGTVMLDGRLVGQWLSEHMGREASRPPTGTSFFDPRQTPAWNVAGAI